MVESCAHHNCMDLLYPILLNPSFDMVIREPLVTSLSKYYALNPTSNCSWSSLLPSMSFITAPKCDGIALLELIKHLITPPTKTGEILCNTIVKSLVTMGTAYKEQHNELAQRAAELLEFIWQAKTKSDTKAVVGGFSRKQVTKMIADGLWT